MIHNIVIGNGFRGVLNYNFQEGKFQDVVAGNMDARTPRELASEFKLSRMQSTSRRQVFHSSISLAPGETLRPDQWNQAIDTYMHGMGFTQNQFIAVRHKDTGKEHVHVIASRVRMDTGGLVSDKHDYKKGMAILRGLEKNFDLSVPEPNKTQIKAPTKDEIEMASREGKPSIKMRMQGRIERAHQTSRNMGEFVQALETLGVGVRANIQSTGRVAGLSFSYRGVPMKASALGKDYRWGNLTKSLPYEQERDLPILKEAKVREEQRRNTYESRRGMADPGRRRHEPGSRSGRSPNGAADLGGRTESRPERPGQPYQASKRRPGRLDREPGREGWRTEERRSETRKGTAAKVERVSNGNAPRNNTWIGGSSNPRAVAEGLLEGVGLKSQGLPRIGWDVAQHQRDNPIYMEAKRAVFETAARKVLPFEVQKPRKILSIAKDPKNVSTWLSFGADLMPEPVGRAYHLGKQAVAFVKNVATLSKNREETIIKDGVNERGSDPTTPNVQPRGNGPTEQDVKAGIDQFSDRTKTDVFRARARAGNELKKRAGSTERGLEGAAKEVGRGVEGLGRQAGKLEERSGHLISRVFKGKRELMAKKAIVGTIAKPVLIAIGLTKALGSFLDQREDREERRTRDRQR